ncbi:histidine kinase [Methylocystis bryophila]|nr:histidine kinase [Methylocystis bryophila]
MERRPDPDALLALVGQEGKGRLRVFLGAAPGVGKTYAMLSRARAAKASGCDVVIGLVETHGRSETEALVEGLEVLPRRSIDYRGRTLEEFDIDAALARKPQTILVDELAHTNAPDSRHPKRWLDVNELLSAGVDVWTTLNIQHLESLADVVTRITGVAVRETVPDRLLADAHDVILVDITPDELLERLSQGKVYVTDMAARARQNFFIPRNLIALRELALRRTAERVDDEMVDLLRQSAIEGPWATSERLLVLVGPGSSGERLVRTAARLASGLNASWIALYIERAIGESQSAEDVKNVDQTLRLAEMLGAEVERRISEDMVGEALKIARQGNITQILVGRSRANFPARLWRPSLASELVRRSANIPVLVEIAEEIEPPRPQRKKIDGASLRFGVAAAVLLVAVTVGAGVLLERWLPPLNFVTIFLLPVLICAARFGLWPAIVAALLSFLAEDYFFIDPRYTFTISEPYEFITLIVSLVVAVVTGMLASRLRDHSSAMRQRAEAAQSLFEFSRKVAGASELDEVLWSAATHAQKTLGIKSVAFLIPEERELAIRAAWPPIDRLDPGESVAARWALDKNEVAGWRTGTLPNVRFQFRPLATSRGVVAVAGVEPKLTDEPFDAQQERMLTAILEQAAIAIDRSLLVKESVRTAALEESERLRTTLLASLSHDLRTPLAAITGAVTSLRQLGDKMAEADRADLLISIEEEAGRLARFVGNLLEMSRIESGALHPRKDLVDVAEVVRATIARCKKVFPNWRPTTSLSPDLPPIRGDANLLGQVLFNLLDNAHKYGAEGNVIVHARRDGGTLVLTVTDEGPGIKPTDLTRVFEKFYRGGRPDGRKAGTGLGLSICKGLVEAMGGTIEAQSPAIKKRGTRMILRFPCERQAAAAPQK